MDKHIYHINHSAYFICFGCFVVLTLSCKSCWCLGGGSSILLGTWWFLNFKVCGDICGDLVAGCSQSLSRQYLESSSGCEKTVWCVSKPTCGRTQGWASTIPTIPYYSRKARAISRYYFSNTLLEVQKLSHSPRFKIFGHFSQSKTPVCTSQSCKLMHYCLE